MTSREQDPDHVRCQATIDRLALELASLREELHAAQRRARTWRRVAEWIYRANRTHEE